MFGLMEKSILSETVVYCKSESTDLLFLLTSGDPAGGVRNPAAFSLKPSGEKVYKVLINRFISNIISLWFNG